MTHRQHVSKEEAAAFQARIVELEAELNQATTRAEAAEAELRGGGGDCVSGAAHHVALWDAINRFAVACGGNSLRISSARMDAVVDVENALRQLLPGRSAASASLRVRAIDDVLAERGRQNEKWGVQSHDPGTWLLILQEEIGEWSQAHLAMRFEGGSATECREELVQVAAVALQMLEAHDRDLPVDLDQVVR